MGKTSPLKLSQAGLVYCPCHGSKTLAFRFFGSRLELDETLESTNTKADGFCGL